MTRKIWHRLAWGVGLFGISLACLAAYQGDILLTILNAGIGVFNLTANSFSMGVKAQPEGSRAK